MKTMTTGAASLALTVVLAGCGGDAVEPPPAEAPTLDITTWTDRSELFMEHPPLVAGEEALFAVHLTDLRDFSAMTEGRPRLELTPEAGGAHVVLQGSEASRPGVFRVLATMPAPGTYEWALVMTAPDFADRHELGTVTVFGDPFAAVAAAEAESVGDPAAISYLKEPQWTNGFAAVVVEDAELRRAVRVPAVIQPLTGGEAVVSTPADGRFMADTLFPVGTRVQAGQELADAAAAGPELR
jgi:hypothetical protein